MNWKALYDELRVTLEGSASLRDRGPLDHEVDLLIEESWFSETGTGAPSRFQRELEPDRIAVPAQVTERAREWARRRSQGELLQHIIGRWHFLDHVYEVNAEVLIPRPETEILVRAVEELITASPKKSNQLLGAEIGIGSGIISTELLSKSKNLQMLASDVSPAAVDLANQNAKRILGEGVSRLRVFKADPYERPCQFLERAVTAGTLDLIVSNPPYLNADRAAGEVEADVAEHEPALALFAPENDLLYFYRDIAQSAPYLLRQGGFVAVEIPHERASLIRDLFSEEGFSVDFVQDLTGRPRVVVARK
jgi:release factor glutamine methyltransferase